MSETHVGNNAEHPGGANLIARAMTSDVRERARAADRIADLMLDDLSRLDEHARFSVRARIDAIVAALQSELRGHAARALSARGEHVLAETLRDAPDMSERLRKSSALRDSGLLEEVLDCTRLDLLARRLPRWKSEDSDSESSIMELTGSADHSVRSCAVAMLASENRRRTMLDKDRLSGGDLSAEQFHALIWLIAASLRQSVGITGDGNMLALDRALIDAARRSLAAHDEGDRLETAALRLARVIDLEVHDLSELLEDALAERRIVLFTALFACGLGVGYEAARDLILSDRPERFWVGLRAVGIAHQSLVRIASLIAEAKGAQETEALADHVDDLAELDRDMAMGLFRPAQLDDHYRAALRILKEEWSE